MLVRTLRSFRIEPGHMPCLPVWCVMVTPLASLAGQSDERRPHSPTSAPPAPVKPMVHLLLLRRRQHSVAPLHAPCRHTVMLPRFAHACHRLATPVYSRSTTVAIPRPPPQHIVCSPKRPPRCSSA